MKKSIMNDSRVLVALVAAALGGCAGAPTGNDPVVANGVGSATTAAAQSPAARIIAENALVDQQLHLVARKVVNNDTEVVEFYEPIPGQILVSTAGSPKGPSQLHMDELRTKPIAESWAKLAPGEEMPSTLADAIKRQTEATYPTLEADRAAQAAVERGETPASSPEEAQPVVASRIASGSDVVAQNTVAPKLANTGYCSSQFWVDFGNVSGNAGVSSFDWTYGWYWQTRSASTNAMFAMCPTGDVSGTGGNMTLSNPNGGASSVWHLGANYYRSAGWNGGVSCHWTLSCAAQGMGEWCTPVLFNLTGRFDSDCYLNKGTSCGDDFGFISWGTDGPQYCQTPNFN